MVGTAVYQVGRKSPSQSKNCGALKPGVQQTLPPAASEASTARDQAVDMEQRHHVAGSGPRASVPALAAM